MKWTLSIEVWCECEKQDHYEPVADGDAPEVEFDRLDDLVAYLDRLAEGSGDEALRKFAAGVKREGTVTEPVIRRWEKKKQPATLSSEVEKALRASGKQRKTSAT
jgi:hypothetical protein